MTKEEFNLASEWFNVLFGFKPQMENRQSLSQNDWIMTFDSYKKLDESVPNYDGKACTYKGKPNYSLRMAIYEEFGIEAVDLVVKMIS